MRRVSAREAFDLMEREGYAYLDVRSVPEFEAGHPHGAFNVPWLEPSADGARENPAFLAQISALFERTRPLVIGCASGVRSLAAAQHLEEQGFSAIVEQRAGMLGQRDAFGRVQERGWQAEGLPVSAQAEPGRGYGEISALAASRAGAVNR